ASLTTLRRFTQYGIGVSMLDEVDNEQPCRLFSRIGAGVPPADRLHHEVSWPVRLALARVRVGHAQASSHDVTDSLTLMLVLRQLLPGGNFEDGRYQLRALFGQHDLLSRRRRRRGEQLLDGDVRLLMRFRLLLRVSLWSQ